MLGEGSQRRGDTAVQGQRKSKDLNPTSHHLWLDSLLSADISSSMGSCFQCHSGASGVRAKVEGWFALSNCKHCM